MKRLLALFLVIPFLFIITACGDTDDATDTDDETSETETDADNEDAAADDSDDASTTEINEVIADGDVKATFVEISKESDEIFGDSYEVVFDIENNLDHSIEVQARSVSADGTMVDESIYSMSQEVAAGKNAKAVLTIEDFEDGNFPDMEEDFEMTLHIMSFDDMDYQEDHDVSVEF